MFVFSIKYSNIFSLLDYLIMIYSSKFLIIILQFIQGNKINRPLTWEQYIWKEYIIFFSHLFHIYKLSHIRTYTSKLLNCVDIHFIFFYFLSISADLFYFSRINIFWPTSFCVVYSPWSGLKSFCVNLQFMWKVS